MKFQLMLIQALALLIGSSAHADKLAKFTEMVAKFPNATIICVGENTGPAGPGSSISKESQTAFAIVPGDDQAGITQFAVGVFSGYVVNYIRVETVLTDRITAAYEVTSNPTPKATDSGATFTLANLHADDEQAVSPKNLQNASAYLGYNNQRVANDRTDCRLRNKYWLKAALYNPIGESAE